MKINKEQLEQAMNNAMDRYRGQAKEHAEVISQSPTFQDFIDLTEQELSRALFRSMSTMFHIGFEAGIEYQKLQAQLPEATNQGTAPSN